jgi:hypothetical protein
MLLEVAASNYIARRSSTSIERRWQNGGKHDESASFDSISDVFQAVHGITPRIGGRSRLLVVELERRLQGMDRKRNSVTEERNSDSSKYLLHV